MSESDTEIDISNMTTEKDVVRKVISVCASIDHPKQITCGLIFCHRALSSVVSDEAKQTILTAQLMLMNMKQAAD
ncbi:MAG: hypothetical protein OEY11_15260 [Gammaproteobacteria bacterium]|nr:hypothetical protein [Gammaproteobacteria bacterium]